ncbi:hypothetical protein DL95DRAFT_503071 [Leptodontidium sp. 2 PMI_412]|nr:hypothetical protein DL95DRAFT_503071 [Leptodontidium sp. 2 PMI_412]
MTREEIIRAWLQASSSLLAAVGILFGVFKYAIERHRKASVEEVGAITLDEQRMGYFAVKIPNRLWAFVFWVHKTAKPPELPTLSTIFKAGEGLIFTSSMFDGIKTPAGGDVVGWICLYEAFFDELAWSSHAENRSNLGDVNEALQAAEKKARAPHQHPTKENRKTWNRHLLYRENLHSSLKGIEGHLDRIQELEKGETKVKYKLEKCVLELGRPDGWQGKKEFDPLLGLNDTWRGDFRQLWIQDGRPCLQVSRNELAALALALGILMRWDNENKRQRLIGNGAFGISISADPMTKSEQWQLHINHGGRDPDQDPSKGSGFLIPCAIFMACKALPFAQSDGYTHAIQLTSTLCDRLQNGDCIKDISYLGEESSVLNLRRMPSGTRPYYYRGYYQNENMKGEIRGKHERTVGHWHEAVAGIAFGGLVPIAAVDLVRAVHFTAAGGTKFDVVERSDFLTNMTRLMWEIQSRESKYQLFGPYVEARANVVLGPSVILNQRPTCAVDISSACAIFGRLTTVLEYLTAIAFDKKDNPAKDVFNACCAELKASHEAAVFKKGNPGGENGVERRTIVQDLDDFVTEFNRSGRCSVIDCGKIARYNILAWTYYVGLAVWDDPPTEDDPGTKDEFERAKTFLACPGGLHHQSHVFQRIYNPMRLEDLPRSFILS